MSDMKLIMENWNKFQFLTEAQEIHDLYETNTITEADFMDRMRQFARKKGIPLAIALSLATGAMGPTSAQAGDAPPDDIPVQVDQDESTATTVDVTVPMRGSLQMSLDRATLQARKDGAEKLKTSPEKVSVQRIDVQMESGSVTVSFNVSVK